MNGATTPETDLLRWAYRRGLTSARRADGHTADRGEASRDRFIARHGNFRELIEAWDEGWHTAVHEREYRPGGEQAGG